MTDGILVVVEDPAWALPTQRSPGGLDEGGRGLLMLGAASSAWGVAQIPDDGKYVWFTIAATRPRSPLTAVTGG